ncbi:hypothetical protein C364_06369 [Cryptococcus neoformans Bt63]|nr:hypothetical protein C364_06369 [Cryptococcus neoformans var. grubii Bt63]
MLLHILHQMIARSSDTAACHRTVYESDLSVKELDGDILHLKPGKKQNQKEKDQEGRKNSATREPRCYDRRSYLQWPSPPCRGYRSRD